VASPIIMQNMLFFYSPLLIHIYWINCYVGSLTCGSDHSSNGRLTSCARFQCDLSSNRHSDALDPVAIVIHQNSVLKINVYTTIIHQKSVPKAKHIYKHYPTYIVHPPYIKSKYQKASYIKFMILTDHSLLLQATC
jgi:hypothetical protein